jgi:hypothetical protein
MTGAVVDCEPEKGVLNAEKTDILFILGNALLVFADRNAKCHRITQNAKRHGCAVIPTDFRLAVWSIELWRDRHDGADEIV